MNHANTPPSLPPLVSTAAAAADPERDFASKSADPDEFYYFAGSGGGGSFYMRNEAGEWVGLGERGFRRHLQKNRGLRTHPIPGQLVSQCDEMVSRIEMGRRVDYAGELAGYKAGIQTIGGIKVLITRAPEMIEPRPGDWSTLRAFFDGLFRGVEVSEADDGAAGVVVDQRDRFYAWHRQIMECYYGSIIASGLALCVAGEADSGKSRLAMILRMCLGDRVAKPYDFMIGRDNFNKDTYSAVLQLVDDENAETSIASRLKFGAQIKKIVANDEGKMRGMHRDGLTFAVLRRLVILVNLEASRLMVMPPMDGDIRDKVLMLKGYRRPRPDYAITMDTPSADACWPMPMPTRTDAEKTAFRDRLRAELPAYLWWLLYEFKMPSEVSGGRFSVKHWAHPQILERLQKFSPHARIWELIESAFVVFHEYQGESDVGPAGWVTRPIWRGGARQLYDLLKSEASRLTQDEKKAIPEPAWLGQRLEDVRLNFGAEVCTQKRSAKAGREWILCHRPGLVD